MSTYRAQTGLLSKVTTITANRWSLPLSWHLEPGIYPYEELKACLDEKLDYAWLDVIARHPHNWFEEHPYIVVAVEQIPRWYSVSECHGRVLSVRTIGIVRQLSDDQYVLESLDDEQSPTQVPLSRSINLSTQVSRYSCPHYLDQEFPNGDSDTLSAPEENGIGRNLSCSCHARVKYKPIKRVVSVNSCQEVLGRISWKNDQPFIDVHCFIEVYNLKSMLKLLASLYRLSRPYMHHYYVLPEEEDEKISEQRSNVRSVNARNATPQ